MFSQLSWKEKPHSSLDLTRGDRRPTDFDTDFKSNSESAVSPLVVVGQFAGLCSDPLKQIIHEGVHDRHGFGRDPRVRVNLLQHLQQIVGSLNQCKYLVDVDCVGFLPLALPFLLVPLGDSFGSLARLGSSFTRSLGRHYVDLKICKRR